MLVKDLMQAIKTPQTAMRDSSQSHKEIMNLPLQAVKLPTQEMEQTTDQAEEVLAITAKLSQVLVETVSLVPGAPGSRTMLSAPGSDNSRETLKVPSDKVGLIIGKGGTKLREIQQVFGVKMDVEKISDAATPHLRNVMLEGTQENIASAKKMIDTIVSDARLVGGFRHTRGLIRNPPSNPNKIIQIPSSTVGLVIGKGGDNIRKIIQNTGCTIHIEKREEAEMAGRTPPKARYQNVYLKGSDDAVRKAEQAIKDLVNGDRGRQQRRLTQQPQYGHYGQQQFAIPQYQLPYGIPAYGSQQMFGLQQPYALSGQSLIQPTYGSPYMVTPGYSQAYPQTYLTPQYNSAALPMNVAQHIGYTPAQYQVGAFQYAQAGGAFSPSGAHQQFNQTKQIRYPNLAQQQDLLKKEFYTPPWAPNQLNKMQSPLGSSASMLYSPLIGGLSSPPGSYCTTPNQTVSRSQSIGPQLLVVPKNKLPLNFDLSVPNGQCKTLGDSEKPQVVQVQRHVIETQVAIQSSHNVVRKSLQSPLNRQGGFNEAQKPQFDKGTGTVDANSSVPSAVPKSQEGAVNNTKD